MASGSEWEANGKPPPPKPSQTKNQEVKLKVKRILPPLTQGLLSPFEDDVRKEKAGLKGNTEEGGIHA